MRGRPMCMWGKPSAFFSTGREWHYGINQPDKDGLGTCPAQAFNSEPTYETAARWGTGECIESFCD